MIPDMMVDNDDANQKTRGSALQQSARKVKEWASRRSRFLTICGLATFLLVLMHTSQMWEVPSLPRATDSFRLSPNSNGWHTIDVFYGDKDLLAVEDGKQWFSQVKQDEIVSTLFRGKTGGFFVDLASNHAVSLSNTLGLERQLQWQGACDSF